MRSKTEFSTFLLFIAVIGTILAWCITDLFIITISFWQFFLIELVISIFHAFYNKAKNQYKPVK